MSGIEEARATIEQLIGEHRRLATLVDRLALAHIWKEERVLFPCYERNISPKQAGQGKIQVLEVIGSAMKPKHPVLLE